MTATRTPKDKGHGTVVLWSEGLLATHSTDQPPLWLVVSTDDEAQKAALVSSSSSTEFRLGDGTTAQTLGCMDGYSVHKIRTLEDLQQALPAHVISTNGSKTRMNGSEKKSDEPSTNSDYYYPQGLDEIKRFELFREMIEHEDDLLNQRVSWIILAQSFLMAAFISASSSVDNRSFLYITASVGLATVIVTMPALLAAGQNIEVQQQVYFLGLDSDEQCRRLHGHNRDAMHKSSDEMVHRRLKGHILPNTAFRGRFGVPILKTVMALAVVQVAGWCGLLVALMMDG